MDSIRQLILEDVIVKEMTIDMCSGVFYTECDDETLELALIQIWEDGPEGWVERGIPIGEA